MSNDAPYLRWFVDDYLSDTGHLTCLERGAYTHILWTCWKRGGSIPERRLQRLVGMTPGQWQRSRDTLAEFFDVDAEGEWRHARIDEEIDYVEARRAAASAAGRKSSARRASRRKAEEHAVAPTASDAEEKAPTAGGGPDGSPTGVEQPLNERSTPVEHPLNHVDREEEGETDTDRRLATLDDDNNTRARTSSSSSLDGAANDDGGGTVNPIAQTAADGPPSDLPDHLRHLAAHHGYPELPLRRNVQNIRQAQAWADDGVTLAELDRAVSIAREQLAARGDQRDPPPRYLAAVIAGQRVVMPDRPIAAPRALHVGGRAGPPGETHAERGRRLAREMLGTDPMAGFDPTPAARLGGLA